jgi:hypothetical protein
MTCYSPHRTHAWAFSGSLPTADGRGVAPTAASPSANDVEDPHLSIATGFGSLGGAWARANRQIHQMPHTEEFADFPLLRTRGRVKTSQQPALAVLLHPVMPALGATMQPLEDHGHCHRDQSLFRANEPTGVFIWSRFGLGFEPGYFPQVFSSCARGFVEPDAAPRQMPGESSMRSIFPTHSRKSTV